uniref:Uncharacterized protein n=1 Tax=Aplanochytrium stocchinoi TaxID=215587 RepID=A0A7S3P9W7_9STRA
MRIAPSEPILFLERDRIRRLLLIFSASAILLAPSYPMRFPCRSRLVKVSLCCNASPIAIPPSAPILLNLKLKNMSLINMYRTNGPHWTKVQHPAVKNKSIQFFILTSG